MPLNWQGQEVTEVGTNQLCPAAGWLKQVCSAAALFGAQHSQYGVSAVLHFKTGLCLSVWVTGTWWLVCFCLHLMHMIVFQFLRWRSQCANKCGLDMRSRQETEISWQKSTAVMLLKVLILFLLLVMFTWQLWSQFSLQYIWGYKKRLPAFFQNYYVGRALFLTVFFFHTSNCPEPDSMPFRWGEPGIQSLANPQEVISSSPSHRSFCLSWSTGSLDWAGGCFSSLPS